MKKEYITIAGTNNYYGSKFLKEGMTVSLIKEPDNKYDREAMRVELEGLGKIGYVANSFFTVLGESMSAGRLYDKMGDTAEAEVVFVLPQGVICRIQKEKPIFK